MAKFQNLKYYSTILSYHSGMLNHPIILYLLVCCYTKCGYIVQYYPVFSFIYIQPHSFSTPLNNFAILKICKKKMDIDYVDIMTAEILSKIQDLIYWSVRFCTRWGWRVDIVILASWKQLIISVCKNLLHSPRFL